MSPKAIRSCFNRRGISRMERALKKGAASVRELYNE